MPVSGGVFTRKHDWTDDRDNNENISADKMDESFDDMKDTFSLAHYRDGQSTATGNWPMGGYKLTGLGTGSAGTDSLTLAQAQAQAFIWCGTATGTGDAIVLTPSPAISAYAAGQCFRFIALDDNTGAATVAISGLTATTITNYGEALISDAIQGGQVYELLYTGSEFEIRSWNISGPLPASNVTDQRIARFDGSWGRLENSLWYITDAGSLVPHNDYAQNVTRARIRSCSDYNGYFSDTLTSSSGTLTIDYDKAPYFPFTLTENITTLSMTNWLASVSRGVGYVYLGITQSASTAHTIDWSGNGWDFGDAGQPDISALGSETWVLLWSPDALVSKYASMIWQKTT